MITALDKGFLDNSHNELSGYIKTASCTTFVAGFLIIASMIVLISSLLCLTLPGINVVQAVILPGVLPSTCGLLISIPFVIKSVKNGEKIATHQKHIIDKWQ